MRQSQLFTKTRKEAPADEISKNARLLIRGGFIQKEMAGVYDYLPLGLRVLNKIEKIIREEINAIGGQEVLMSALQDKETWGKTGRWSEDVIDVWFKTALKNEGEIGLAATHEEPITRIMSKHIQSYNDLPNYIYQFQTKFRNEMRAKSGIMRTREFIMKDLYSFDIDQIGLDAYYEKVADTYKKIFDRVGLGSITYRTFASGGPFSKYSHEFQTVCEAGEDTIFIDDKKNIAINKEVMTEEVLADLTISKDDLKEKKSVEVGNIFKLGTRFSEVLGLNYIDENGQERPVVMGSYGLGPARMMGTVVEVLSDDRGIIWPETIAPFRAHLLAIGKSPEVLFACDTLYEKLDTFGVETLYDDRDLRAGEKFADSDLIGIPYRVVISDKTLTEKKLEVKKRNEEKSEMISEDDFLKGL